MKIVRENSNGEPSWYSWSRQDFQDFWERLFDMIEQDKSPEHRVNPLQLSRTFSHAEQMADKWFSCFAGALCPGPLDEQATVGEACTFADSFPVETARQLEELAELVYLRRWDQVKTLYETCKNHVRTVPQNT